MNCKFVIATLALLVGNEFVSAQQIPPSTTAAELWNPWTWFWPYAIASAEAYKNYFEKAQKATNELYQQIYKTNANPLVTGNWGPQIYPGGGVVPSNPAGGVVPSNPAGGSGQTNPAGGSGQTNPAGGSGQTNPAGGSGQTNPAGGSGQTNPAGGSGQTNPAGGSGQTNPAGGSGQTNPAGGSGQTNPAGGSGTANQSSDPQVQGTVQNDGTTNATVSA